MYSLTQHIKSICGNRDSLSLFVEYCGENKIRVHRQFYIHSQFELFFIENNANVKNLDYRDVTNDVEFDEYRRLLLRLINRRNKSDDDRQFLDELSSVINEAYSFGEVDNNEQLIEKHLATINEVFCKYRFSLEGNTFLRDDGVYNKINEVFESIPYNRDIHYEDYEKGCKPEIETADEQELYELRIFNVGQANCSALIKYTNKEKEDYKVIIVFDLGFQKSAGHNKKLDEMISKIDCNTTLLISHYDSDHINNISNHLYLTTCRWIFPNYDGKGKKALKTFQILMKVASRKTGSRIVYNFPTPFSFSPNVSIHQYDGVRKADPYQSTLMNSKCLVCKLSIGGKDVLIPADSLYEEFGDELILPDNKKYDYLLVPHHGCKYIGKAIANHTLKIWKFVDDNTIGIVMCGKNTYGHANNNHLSWFNGKAFLFDKSCVYDDNKNFLGSVSITRKDFYSIKFS